MSAPATKLFSPLPVTMTAETLPAVPASAKKLERASRVSPLSALSLSGRLTVSTAKPSTQSTRRLA